MIAIQILTSIVFFSATCVSNGCLAQLFLMLFQPYAVKLYGNVLTQLFAVGLKSSKLYGLLSEMKSILEVEYIIWLC